VVWKFGLGSAYRLLLLAHTVQNFSLKLSSAGSCSPGFWPLVVVVWERSSVPSRPMVVVSGTSSGGGGGGGGCARRLGSVDMVTMVDWIRLNWACFGKGLRWMSRGSVLHVKMDGCKLLALRLENWRSSSSDLLDGILVGARSFQVPKIYQLHSGKSRL
jgi:hypothetical protein